MNAYAGIGSRETPREVQIKMTEIATHLSRHDYTLYSGGADGADTAFEVGAKDQSIIFLPWSGFNGKKGIVPNFVPDMVEKYHPKSSNLSDSGWKFMSRNTYQVLGPDLKSPVEFVLCWTKDGKPSGGTGQALRIAKDYQIPIFNFRNEDDYEKFQTYMSFNHMITL